jgi:hypothetical protein
VNAGNEQLFLLKILKFFVNPVLRIQFLVRKIQIQDLGSGMEKSRSWIKLPDIKHWKSPSNYVFVTFSSATDL